MFYAADLFCGAGGTSTGLVRAAEERGVQLNLLAVNHWAVAVDTHTRNHPWAQHLCADLGSVDPSRVVPGGKLDLLVASPECTHFSVARGGKPCSDQSRASAWHAVHWLERLQVDEFLMENVREFETWGPLTRKGQPNKKKRGATFAAFVNALESLGYAVEWKILNAADYGDATSRKRLFLRASRRRKIVWPEPSHVGRWRPAREVIDWGVESQSIFKRKRPLRAATLRRIEAGLKKFGGEPFIAVLRGTLAEHPDGGARSVEQPLGTVTAGGMHAALCEPFVLGQQSGSVARSTKEPIPTVSTSGAIALVQPFILAMEHCGSVRSTEKPLPTITTAKGGAFGLCQPFLTKYYGSGTGARPVTEPFDTITAKDRFALVEPGKMDILFRMLQPHELAAAMGFDGYQFAGTKTDQVRQIGNAVSVRTAKALCGSVMDLKR